jgi:hypothetical protein
MSVCIEIQDQEDYCIGQQCTPRRGWLHQRRNREGEKKTEPCKIGQWNRYIMAPTPALAHIHTRIRTCHVLLLFITIIVTTGIVFVV